MSVYKKFTAQDFAIVPFNAHKQYDFVSSSAASNKVTYYSSRHTSESYSLYSSASTNPDGLFDQINTIKYNQIDHLFYRNFKTSHADRFDKFGYLTQKRDLYERANILSIPSGLYGHEIKPTSFYLSSSNEHVVDDGKGNLIISGTNVNDYPIDVRSNLFRLDPIKGFKLYDLHVFQDYAIKLRDPQGKPYEVSKQFWRRGQINPNVQQYYSFNFFGLQQIVNPIDTLYTTPTHSLDIDDSYFFNKLKFCNVSFSTSSQGSLEITQSTFSSINYNAHTGSFIVSPDDTKYDFNNGDDFAVSFYMRPKSIYSETPGIGDPWGGGYIFALSQSAELDDAGNNITYAYVVHPKIHTVKSFQSDAVDTSRFSVLPVVSDMSGSATSSGFNHYRFQDETNFTNVSNKFSLPGPYFDYSLFAWLSDENGLENDDAQLFPETIGKITDEMPDVNGFTPTTIDNPNAYPNIFMNPYGPFTINGVGNLYGPARWRHFSMNVSKVTTFCSGSTWLESGKKNTEEWLSNSQGDNLLPVIKAVRESTAEGFNDWWLPSYDEYNRINQVFGGMNPMSSGVQQSFSNMDYGVFQGFDNTPYNPPEMDYFSNYPFTDPDGVLGQTYNTRIEGTFMRYGVYNDNGDIFIGGGGIIQGPWMGENTGDYGPGGFLENNRDLGIMVNGYTKGLDGDIDATGDQDKVFGHPEHGANHLTDETKDLIFYTSNARHVDEEGNAREVICVPSKAPLIDLGDVGAAAVNVSPSLRNNTFMSTWFMSRGFPYNNDGVDGIEFTLSGLGYSGFPSSLGNGMVNTIAQSYNKTTTLTPGNTLPYYPMPIDFRNKPPGIEGIALSPNSNIFVGADGPTNLPPITYDYNEDSFNVSYEEYPALFDIVDGQVIVTEGQTIGGEGYFAPSGSTDFNEAIQGVIENVPTTTDGDGTGLTLDIIVTAQDVHGGQGPGEIVQATTNPSCLPFCVGYQIGDVITLPGNTVAPYSDGTYSNIFDPSNTQSSPVSFTITDVNTGGEKFSPCAHLMVRKEPLILEMDDKKRYILSKSTTKTEIPPVVTTPAGKGSAVVNTNTEGNAQTIDIDAEIQFPFEIYMSGSELFFDRYDGEQKQSVKCLATASTGETHEIPFHVLCQSSASVMELYLDGHLKDSKQDLTKKSTQNRANLYIGAKGKRSSLVNNYMYTDQFYNGELSMINIYDRSFNATASNGAHPIKLISESVNGSPYIGNLFYQNGFAVITHPKYQQILGSLPVGDFVIGESFTVDSESEFGIDVLQFQGSHLIYEHEYQCTVDEHEFNDTLNISARQIPSSKNYEVAGFTTGSLFKPYVTTIGLYNDNGELLVVGKLGQPIRTSNETDTTFIVRWDS